MEVPFSLGEKGEAVAPNPLASTQAPSRAGEVITVRDLRFRRGNWARRWWLAGDAVASAWHNSLSGTFPRGEAFFIESVKAFRDDAPPALQEQIRRFVVQEINHTREHLAFNRVATDAGYDMARIDARVEQLLAITKSRPPIVHLAATMALEHFTAMMAHEFLANPQHFAGADEDIAWMWRWHAIEEIEHKAVDYDTWLHATRGWSRRKRWRVKALTMLIVTRQFLANRFIDTLDLLEQDGFDRRRMRWPLLKYLVVSPGVLRRIFPAWLAYFLPGFHPWQVDDRGLMQAADAALRAG